RPSGSSTTSWHGGSRTRSWCEVAARRHVVSIAARTRAQRRTRTRELLKPGAAPGFRSHHSQVGLVRERTNIDVGAAAGLDVVVGGDDGGDAGGAGADGGADGGESEARAEDAGDRRGRLWQASAAGCC